MELFKRAQEENIHTTLDTSGYSRWEKFQKVLNYTDLVLFDLKTHNSKIHRQLTGVSSDLILENLQKLAGKNIPTVIRLPIIPGYNFLNLDNDIEQLLRIFEGLNFIQRVDILPFHRLGKSKAGHLGRKYTVEIETPNKEYMDKIREIIEAKGMKVGIGGLI